MTFRIGFATVLIGIDWFFACARWTATRIWVPLDMPVSLSQGRIRTTEFKINVESTYLFEVQVKPEFDFEGGPCLVGRRCPSSLDMSWSLWNGGKVILHAEKFPGGRLLGGFHVGKGRYVLDLDVLRDGSLMNAGDPHLVVFEDGSALAVAQGWEAGALLFLLVSSAVGICLMLRAAILRRQANWDALVRTFSLTRPGPHPLQAAGPFAYKLNWTPTRTYIRRLSTVPLFSTFSRYSLLAAIVLFLSAMAALGLPNAWNVTPGGLSLHLWRPAAVAKSSPGIQPLVVHVIPEGIALNSRLLVNSQPVSWANFAAVLQQELVRRPLGWPVYVEGDPAMDWGVAMKVIAAIKAQQAEVVLLKAPTTPPIVRARQ